MRFSQLPVGQRFEFEGVRYVKTAPMLAAEEAGGKSRFIAKYAMIEPLGATGADAPALAATSQVADTAAMTAAFEDFYRQARVIIDRLGADADATTVSRARSDLYTARTAFLAALARIGS